MKKIIIIAIIASILTISGFAKTASDYFKQGVIAEVLSKYSLAAKLYKKACDKGDAKGCSNLGVLYEDGQGVDRNYAMAAKLFKKACDKGFAKGCYNLGVLYEYDR